VSLPWLGKDERPPADDSGLREKAPAEHLRSAELRPGRRFWRWLANGARPEPVPSFLGPVETPEEGKVGISCSGGGIRSAAFSLGALQVLDQKGKLREAAYLAAVSGGSYLAAAISTVAKTGPGDSDPALLKVKGPFAPNSPEELYATAAPTSLRPPPTRSTWASGSCSPSSSTCSLSQFR
jgi:Patatin-like phospholipase